MTDFRSAPSQHYYFSLVISNLNFQNLEGDPTLLSSSSIKFILAKSNSKYAESGSIKIEVDGNRIIFDSCQFDFFISNFSPQRIVQFSLKLLTQENDQEIEIGAHQIECCRYIEQGNQYYQQEYQFGPDYKGTITLFVNKSRFELEKLMREIKIKKQNGQKRVRSRTEIQKSAQITPRSQKNANNNIQKPPQNRFLSPKKFARKDKRKLSNKKQNSVSNSQCEDNSSDRELNLVSKKSKNGFQGLIESTRVSKVPPASYLIQSTRTFQPPKFRDSFPGQLPIKKIESGEESPRKKQILSTVSKKSHLKKADSIIIFNQQEMEVHKVKLKSQIDEPIKKLPTAKESRANFNKKKQTKPLHQVHPVSDQNFKYKILAALLLLFLFFIGYNTLKSSKQSRNKKWRNK